ncbi:hypothetical protein DFR24_4400 [Panacagrimonas perspica]|uniref:FkbM family methyltransferase n=1 Tax=Panacagrimonas perspica TaxID=381431 RepID=A0A4R7NT61_9GAMM|nr:hypothetical protein [Panacagrimonas perspica]TDU24137.1 hypothetical protein DFR24_4400 [Panacagrimonas perspica]
MRLLTLDRRIDEIKINQGLVLCELQRGKPVASLSDVEFKVFSQWGEDGILQFLIRELCIENRTFIEFGVEDFFESNSRFLLMKDLWKGYVIDGSQRNVERLRRSYFYWKYPLKSRAAFITRENVADLLDESGFDKRVGVMSVDVDGVDYYLLEALAEWRAEVIVVEYNSIFGARHAVSVPYSPGFSRSSAHHSNLYWGASLTAFDYLLSGRGYSLVGVNSVGSNAFFVRRELLNERVKAVPVADCFRESSFREARDERGELRMISAREGRDVIGHLPLVDVSSGAALRVAETFDSISVS